MGEENLISLKRLKGSNLLGTYENGVTKKITDFQPFLYATVPNDIRKGQRDGHLTKKCFWTDEEVETVKINYKHPRQVKSIREEADVPIFRSDVGYLLNYALMNESKPPSKLNVVTYDIETVPDTEEFLMSAVSYGQIKFDESCHVWFSDPFIVEDPERLVEILEKTECQFSHNGLWFDNRVMENYGLETHIQRMNNPRKDKMEKAHLLPNALNIDTMQLANKFINQTPSLALKVLAVRENLGEAKFMPVSMIEKAPKNELAEYNKNDVRLTNNLVKKFINQLYTVWSVLKIPPTVYLRFRGAGTYDISTCLFDRYYGDEYYLPAKERNVDQEGKYGNPFADKYKGKKMPQSLVIPPDETGYAQETVENVIHADFSCLDEETEILAESGWKDYQDLEIGEKVLAFDKEEEKLKYERVKDKFVYDYDEELVSVDKKLLDMKITPNHRVIYREERGSDKGELKVDKARDLKTYISIPLSADFDGFEVDFISNVKDLFSGSVDEFFKFLGIVISEGNIREYNSVVVSQTGEEIEDFRKLFDSLGVDYGVYERDRTYNGEEYREVAFCIHSEQSEFLKKILDEESRISDDMLKVSYKYLEKLYEGLMIGDGSDGRKYITCNPKLADKFQELCIKLGKRCIISEDDREDGTLFCYIYDDARATLFLNKNKTNKEDLYERVDYKGKVWCVSVPSSFFVVRRNKKHFITGNSMFPNILLENDVSPEKVWEDEDGEHEVIIEDKKTGKQELVNVRIEEGGFHTQIMGKLIEKISYYKEKAKEDKSYYDVYRTMKAVFRNNMTHGSLFSRRRPSSCRFLNPLAGSKILTESVKLMEELVEGVKEAGGKIVDVDTDGVYIDGMSYEKVCELVENYQYEIDVESYDAGHFASGKNYVVLDGDEITVKGANLWGKDIPIVCSRAFRKAVKKGLKKGKVGWKESMDFIKNYIESDDRDLLEFTFRVSKRPPEEYKRDYDKKCAEFFMDKFDFPAGYSFDAVMIKEPNNVELTKIPWRTSKRKQWEHIMPLEKYDEESLNIDWYMKKAKSILNNFKEKGKQTKLTGGN